MRRHLNTLYVTTEDAWLSKDGENAVVKADGKECGRVPMHLLGGIVCFGAVGATPATHGALCGLGGLFLLHEPKWPLSRSRGRPCFRNVLLRRSQYRATDDEAMTTAMVRNLVTGKILNQRTVIRRGLRDHGESSAEEARDRLKACERRLTDAVQRGTRAQGSDSLRGIEGEAARVYFEAFGDLVRSEETAFRFCRRSRRPPA